MVHNSCELLPATVISSMHLSGGRARQVIFGRGVCVMKGGCNAIASPSTTVGESMACLLVPGQPGVRAERRAIGPRRGSVREINSWCGQCASMIEATSYAREARVYSAVLVRAAAVCMGRSQHADGAEALAIVFRCSTCENSRQRYERFPRAKTDPRRSVAPKKESLCMADRNAVAGTIDTRFFSVAVRP